MTVFLVYNAAHSDADIADMQAWMAWYVANAPVPATPALWFDAGDSEVQGQSSLLGGDRPESIAIAAPSRRIVGVGPYGDPMFGYMRGASGELAQTVASNLAAFAAFLVAANLVAGRDVITLAWGVNDLGNGYTAAQIQTAMAAIYAQCGTTCPGVRVRVRSIVKPGPAAAGGYGANRAVADVVNAAWTVTYGANFVDIGAPVLGPDDIHPATAGYSTMSIPEGASIS
jgi:hypothetical protein